MSKRTKRVLEQDVANMMIDLLHSPNDGWVVERQPSPHNVFYLSFVADEETYKITVELME